jgi:anaerobic ribonucleoside-triphosphate reductase activating protein
MTIIDWLIVALFLGILMTIGYLFSRKNKDVEDYFVLSYVDVLVDGPFIEAEKDLSLRFRGSRNQRIIDVKKSLRAGEVVLWEEEE